MTEEQCKQSCFIIDNAHFIVDDYSFRAIDLSTFGSVDNAFIGLIAYSKTTATIVFLYFCHDLASIEPISVGIGPDGYMEFYSDSWNAES